MAVNRALAATIELNKQIEPDKNRDPFSYVQLGDFLKKMFCFCIKFN